MLAECGAGAVAINDLLPPSRDASYRLGMTPKTRRSLTIGALALVVTPILLLAAWPYRAETVEAVVERASNGCSAQVTQVSRWEARTLSPGIEASDVAYPLSVFVLVDCEGEKPFGAELVHPAPGAAVVEGSECGRSPASTLPCRLEAPPIASRAAPHRFVVKVVRRQGDAPTDIKVEVTTRREWRSVFLDALMSV